MLRKGRFGWRRGQPMTMLREAAPPAGAGWQRLAAVVLAAASLGLPINHVGSYALLLIATIVIFTGEVSDRMPAWAAAAVIVVFAVAGQWLLSPPRVAEGHNVFLPGPPDNVLQRGLPPDVYRHMADEFDVQYPPTVRCLPGSTGCWQNTYPDRTFGFSADGIFHPSDLSRSVTALDFSNPVWLRLGFINEKRYDWTYNPPDVSRADRARRFWMGPDRWRLLMPWFETIRLPAAFAGGELCWRGEIMAQGVDGHFTAQGGDRCRAIEPGDTGRLIFGIAIKPGTLAMQVTPPWKVRLLQFAHSAIAVAAVCALIAVLVRLRTRRVILPCILIGVAVLAIAVDDASFLGGVHPFDGGDDGLIYDGFSRIILQNLLAGNIYGALEGAENVYYFGGPGLRYFLALEHIVFGESHFGYLSLVLLLPFLAYLLARRFLPERWALGFVLAFTAIPVGDLFGTTFIDYGKWAARGYADPAAYIFFFAAMLPLIGATRAGPDSGFRTAFFGALLLALAVFTKPIILPAAAIMLSGAGLAAIAMRDRRRVVGLCVGFIPVLAMPLHNWVYGHVFVALSSNADSPLLLKMPPSAYLAALHELLTMHFEGGYAARALVQIPKWLSGPAESYATVPLNAAGVAILIYVVIRGRDFDPWLRLIGVAALAQHAVALFYIVIPRYHFLEWFFTGLVAMAWTHRIGLNWIERHYPDFWARLADHPLSRRLASGLARLETMAS
jgi:hypothetical protein